MLSWMPSNAHSNNFEPDESVVILIVIKLAEVLMANC